MPIIVVAETVFFMFRPFLEMETPKSLVIPGQTGAKATASRGICFSL
jgi:hypothetical protein